LLKKLKQKLSKLDGYARDGSITQLSCIWCFKWTSCRFSTQVAGLQVQIKAADTYLKDKNNARNSGSARFQVTRRIITIMVISTFCFIHIVPAWTGIPVYVFYTESNGLFSSIFYGDSSIHVQDLRGFVITPALTYLVGMLAGLYYGINNVGK
jgi:hypothetical protein